MLSIVIPVYNKFSFTKSCLSDLFKLPKDTHEIIVVDNGSADDTEQELRKIKENNFVYLRNDENKGFSSAVNRGYNNSKYDNVCFLNNDIRVKSNYSDWTKTIIDNIDDNSLVGPTAGYVDPKNDYQFVYETNDPKKPINYMSGWCLSANKKVFSKFIEGNSTGPFNDELFFCFFEDTNMGLMARKLGIKFKIIDIPVVHFGHISAKQLNISKLYNDSRKIFLKKWSK